MAPGQSAAGRLGRDHTFEWRILPGRLAIAAKRCDDSPFDTPPTWLVKQIVAGGRDVTDEGLDVGADGLNDVEVMLTAGARLAGVVRGEDGAPQPNRVVIVFSQDRAHWTHLRNRHSATSVTDPQGRFLAAVPPGDYHVAAIERGSILTWSDPEFLESLVPTATRISLTDRDARAIDLVVATR